MSVMLRITTVGAALLALAPAVASAGSVSVVDEYVDHRPVGEHVLFTGGDEVNDVTLAEPESNRHVITDSAAPLDVAEPCKRIDEHTAECPGLGVPHVILGGGDDRLTTLHTASVAAGGPGNDTLIGGQYDDVLNGGPGSDVLEGGDGLDELRGWEADPQPDTLDGGPDEDQVTYEPPADAPVENVTIDLRGDRPSGPGLGQDTLRSIEDAEAGPGDDTIWGNAGPNRLVGGDGADLLHGLAGDDQLTGELTEFDGPDQHPGADLLDGGPGADLLDLASNDGYGGQLGDMRPDRAHCGAGAGDRVLYSEPFDLARDCEEVSVVWQLPYGIHSPTFRPTTVVPGRRSLSLEVASVHGVLSVRGAAAPHRLLGSSVRLHGSSAFRRVTVTLTATGRALARTGRPVTLRFTVPQDDSGVTLRLARL